MAQNTNVKVHEENSSRVEENANHPKSSLVCLALNGIHNYDIKTVPDVIDVYTHRSVPSPQGVESPETKKRRIEIITKQCRLHPSNKKYNQGPVINPPPISPGIVVGYTPAGQRHEVDLNAGRPTWFDSEYSRMQYDTATKINVSRMMHDLSKGYFLPDTLDPDVERQYIKKRELVKEEAIRYFENKRISQENLNDVEAVIDNTNTMQFLETEHRMIEITEFARVKIDDFPSELSKKIQDFMTAELKPLMFLKNAYIVEIFEELATQSTYIDVARSAHALYNKIKLLFDVPKGQSFMQYFMSEVQRLGEETKDMTMIEVSLMTEEPNKTLDFEEGRKNQMEDNPVTSESSDEVEVEWVPVEGGDHWENIETQNNRDSTNDQEANLDDHDRIEELIDAQMESLEDVEDLASRNVQRDDSTNDSNDERIFQLESTAEE